MKKTITCRGLFGEEKEVLAEELSFRPSVYGVVVKDNAVLLSPQWDGYDFPGGGIKPGETIDEALRRTFLKETGFVVKRRETLVAETSFFVFPGSGDCFETILLYFKCEIISGEISTENLSEDEKEAEWVDLFRIDDLKYMNTIDTSPSIIKKAIQ